jgi:hypothetical protein
MTGRIPDVPEEVWLGRRGDFEAGRIAESSRLFSRCVPVLRRILVFRVRDRYSSVQGMRAQQA